jgi:hypothetical protein
MSDKIKLYLKDESLFNLIININNYVSYFLRDLLSCTKIKYVFEYIDEYFNKFDFKIEKENILFTQFISIFMNEDEFINLNHSDLLLKDNLISNPPMKMIVKSIENSIINNQIECFNIVTENLKYILDKHFVDERYQKLEDKVSFFLYFN